MSQIAVKRTKPTCMTRQIFLKSVKLKAKLAAKRYQSLNP